MAHRVLKVVGLGLALVIACSGAEQLNPVAELADGGGGSGGGNGGAPTAGGGGAGPTVGGGGAAPASPGALVEIEMWGEVGVLLDELPASIRNEVAASYILAPQEQWVARAERQLDRTDIYFSYLSTHLPLPPKEVWNIKLSPGLPYRTTRDGHDYVVQGYTFESILFTDEASPGQYGMEVVGATRDEKVVLPLDPDLLYHRIAETCVDGSGFGLPYFSCVSVLEQVVGSHQTWRQYKRLAWDETVAEAARVGQVTNLEGADLDVRLEGIENNRIRYRYFPPSSCAIQEGCVGGSGWRRILEFDASVMNLGAKPLHFGNIVNGPWLDHNTFFYSPCHQHLHFLFYGDYDFGPVGGDKRAFCLISTSRFLNNEFTPLDTPYDGTCVYQGIEAGWGDDYFIGLDCQWIDITDLDLSAGPATHPLTFTSNPDEFLCEGVQQFDDAGELIFESTSHKTEFGDPIDRAVCEFMDDWDSNNSETTMVDVPVAGSFHTQACGERLIGPRRSCGFTVQSSAQTCTPGETVTMDCSMSNANEPMLVRICEDSVALGTTITCSFFGSAATQELTTTGSTQFSFTCPAARDTTEVGGLYSIMTAPFVSDGTTQPVTCNVL